MNNTINFKNVSIATAAVGFSLFFNLLVFPEPLFALFEIPQTESAFFIARRTAILFLGICIMSWVGRNAEHSESRQAISLGLAISMIGLVILGSAEFIRGYAGMGIGLAILPEVLLSSAYLSVWFANRNVAVTA